MSHPLEGRVRVYTNTAASVGAGNTVVTMRPAEGVVWEILWAFGWQDDGAVNEYWQITDEVGTETVGAGTAAAGNRTSALYLLTNDDANTATNHALGPLVSTYRCYYSFFFTASGAAKNGYVVACVKEFKGVDSVA